MNYATNKHLMGWAGICKFYKIWQQCSKNFNM